MHLRPWHLCVQAPWRWKQVLAWWEHPGSGTALGWLGRAMAGGRALGHQLQVGGPGRQSVETCGGFLQSCLGCSIPGHQQKVGQPQLHRLRVGTEPQQPSSARRDAISIPLQSPPASTLCYKGPGATICGRLEELISLSFCSNNGNKKRTR